MIIESELYKRARLRFGEKDQMIKCIEEMSELQKVICKILINDKRKDYTEEIIQELADVEIMIDQLKRFFGVDLVVVEKMKKLIRLEERLK